MKDGFQIKFFDDYHEIPEYARQRGFEWHELGGFYAKKGPKYLVYFGLFWKGTKPQKQKVLNSLKALTASTRQVPVEPVEKNADLKF